MLASGDGFGCTPLKEKSIADAFFNTQDNVGAVHAHIKKGSKVACPCFFFPCSFFNFPRKEPNVQSGIYIGSCQAIPLSQGDVFVIQPFSTAVLQFEQN